MANTTIQILRSYTSNAPASNTLSDGEPAYSFVSNTLFIGDQYGDVIKIGGEYYTHMLDEATPNEIPNTLVLRDANGTVNVAVTIVDGGIF